MGESTLEFGIRGFRKGVNLSLMPRLHLLELLLAFSDLQKEQTRNNTADEHNSKQEGGDRPLS